MFENQRLTGDKDLNARYRAARDGSLRIDLSDLEVIRSGEENIGMDLPAWITVGEDRKFYLHLRGVLGEESSALINQVFQRLEDRVVEVKTDQCFRIRARSGNGHAVILEGVLPIPSSTQCIGEKSDILEIQFERLALPAEGWDALTGPQIRQYFEEIDPTPPESQKEEDVAQREPEDSFFAILPGVKQLVFSTGTDTTIHHPFHGDLSSSKTNCFTGEACGGRYCLEEVEEGILVDFRCPVGDTTFEEASVKFHALLQAIGLIHGFHPWPDYFCHRRDSRIHERWIHPRPDIQRRPLLPMAKRDMNPLHPLEIEHLFRKAAEFFATGDEDTKACEKALWLMRESCHEGIAKEISMLTLCSLFEGLIKPLRGKEPCKRLKGDDIKRYRWIDPIQKQLQMPFSWFEEAVDSFDTFRNPLAHGFDVDSDKRDTFELLNAYSRLFGAIYMILARKMGYKGTINRSFFEKNKRVDFGKLKNDFLEQPSPSEQN